MQRWISLLTSPLVLGCALAALGLGLIGCSSPDQENRAERPWAAPAGWEGGIPPSLYDRERK